MSEAISFSTRFCADVGWKGRIFLMACAGAIIQLKCNAGLCFLLAAFQLEPQFHEKQFFKNETNVGRRARRLQVLQTLAGIRPMNPPQGLAGRDELQAACEPSPGLGRAALAEGFRARCE